MVDTWWYWGQWWYFRRLCQRVSQVQVKCEPQGLGSCCVLTTEECGGEIKQNRTYIQRQTPIVFWDIIAILFVTSKCNHNNSAKPATQTFNHNCFLSDHQKSTSSTTDLIQSDDHNQKSNSTHRSYLIWWSQPARTFRQPQPPTPGVLVVGRLTSVNLIFARCQQRHNININKI